MATTTGFDTDITTEDGPDGRRLVGLGQSRRTESYWTKTTITDVDTGTVVARVLLHSGVFKDSYPGYPKN